MISVVIVNFYGWINGLNAEYANYPSRLTVSKLRTGHSQMS